MSRDDIDASRSALNREQPYASEADADAYLQQATVLQDLSSIARVPRPRRRQQGHGKDKLPLKPHEKTGLATHIDKEATIGGSVLADAMGLGKTELFVALLIAGNASEAHRVRLRGETTATGINAVVVLSKLGAYMTEKLHDTLGVGWRVYRLGHHKQLYEETNTKRRIKIGGQEVPWSERESSLGDDLIGSHSDDLWQNLFRRMICNEGHSLRRFDGTLRGKNARRFVPKYRHVVTGTPILCTARDFRGYVALVKRPDWLRSDIDQNEETDANGDMRAGGRYNRYREEVSRCKMADRLPNETQFANDGDNWRPNVQGQTQEKKKSSLDCIVYELRKRKTFDLYEEEDPFTTDVAVLNQALRGATFLANASVDV
ncbi:hypothetical protein KC330_g8789 [Hortaea werneckii]|nr:hypothetical protein KC330_g8789 [Hortaea werneckii]